MVCDHFHLSAERKSQPGPKFDYKLAWFERLIEHGAELMNAGVPVVLAGDYNVVPAVQDIYPPRSLDNNALIPTSESPTVCSVASSGLDGRSAKTATRGGRSGRSGTTSVIGGL
jgi:exonuclease III